MKIRGDRGRASHNLLVIPTLPAYDLTTLKYSTTGPGRPARETVQTSKRTKGTLSNTIWNIDFDENDFELKNRRQLYTNLKVKLIILLVPLHHGDPIKSYMYVEASIYCIFVSL